MTAFAFRGRRVAYDNIAVGSIAGNEKTISGGVSDVSGMGDAAGATATISNVAVGSVPGIEDTDNATADKITSDGETVAD